MPTISVNISQARGPAVRTAVLSLYPRPLAGEADHIDGETDTQWMQRFLVRRFRRVIIAIMKKADRQERTDPDPGIAEE